MKFNYDTLRNNKDRLGSYKGHDVYAISTFNYQDTDEVVYVIYDDGMKLVDNGYVVGILEENGDIENVDRYRYVKMNKREHTCMTEDKHTLAEELINEYTEMSIEDLLK